MFFHICLILIVLIESLILFQVNHSTYIKKIYLTIIFIQLFIISAFRSEDIGNDTKIYLELFDNLANGSNILNYLLRYEIGFLSYTKILTIFTSNHYILNIISSLIILTIIFYVINNNLKYVWLAILLFLNLRFFYMSLNILRQFIAISILFYSLNYIYKGNLIRFLLLVLLASTFHITSILFLPVYTFRNFRINKKLILIFLFIGVAFFITLPYLIDFVFSVFPRFSIYQNSKYFTEGIKLASFINLLIYIFLITIFAFAYRSASFSSEEDIKKINVLFYIVYIGILLNFISINLNLIDRIVIYFTFFNILLIPKILELHSNKLVANSLAFLIIFTTTIYNLSILYFRPEWNHVYPYKFFWQ